MTLTIAWLVCLTTFGGLSPAQAQPPKTTGPNIIFILADDLGYNDLSIMGQENFSTPRLDRMAREGIVFMQHYAGSTVCAPSRATLLTGNHTGRVWQRGNRTPQGGHVQFRRDPHDITIATRLQDIGYHTAMIGKSGVACNSNDATLPNDKGFTHFFGFLAHRDAHHFYPTELVRNGEVVTYPDNHIRHGKHYSGDLFLADVLDYLQQRAEGDQPFFLHFAMQQPHADMAVPEAFRARYLSQFEEQPFEGGHYTAQSHPKATYAAMVAYLDHSVGAIVDKLHELGLAENTLVIFSSDNGSHAEGGYHWRLHNSNAPFRGGKRDLYEGGIRVPTIAWWPGTISPDRTTDHISAFWDFPPTALELAGAPVPDEMDGISYVPTLLGKGEQRQHEYLVWEFYEQGGRRAMRWGDWKIVELGMLHRRAAPIELYNIADDPGERRNVAGEHPEVVERMITMMDAAHEPTEFFTWPHLREE